ncbi:hypothetical protein TOPH_03569 [Tolypocladium ophioglossoides CBS 100239]|uniref:Uncharacterized protein n=1 Tax=Tolypocladium ophioglossoides (strain CBS 100239) TaxID=1163406 RepID=A0A0L0NEA8_TOLOC|nr:hypothetical protein TOPH_03569 [Tolypocladium ophioglossoides CBS 100239]
MALWPFRRKGARKRSRSGAALSDGEGPPPRSHAEGAMTRAVSKKKQRTEPAKLQRRQRTYSFSPGRNDSIRVDRHNNGAREGTHPAGSAADSRAEDLAWERTPTLYHNNGHPPTRRKSSKRRREDPDREAEIKAMSAFMPTRAATDVWASGALTKQSSKRVKTTGNGGQWDKPTSNVSLPLPDSLHSTLSSDSEFVSYKVSALDSLLAPRPTLRCALGTRWAPSRAPAPTRPGSQKKSFIEREAIPEEMLDSRRRIDDLADGLDASDLRELMERDNRRRERKRQDDQERMERRLARRAEKQRREEAEAKKSGTPPPENLERGVMGRELVGLGIEPPSAVVTSSRKREPPAAEPMADTEEVQSKEPLESFHRTDTNTLEEPSSVEEPRVPIVRSVPPPVADEPASAQGSMLAGMLRSKKSPSKSTLSSDKDKMMVEDDSPRKDSESSIKAARLSFTSFLKWGGRHRRNSGPSSFSNTSREEMQAAATAHAQAQAQAEALARLQGDDVAIQGNYLASKIGAGPKRTRSRFREDLPEFPLSPPDSRVQSPEAEPPLPIVAKVETPDTGKQPGRSAHQGTPPSDPRPIEGISQTQTATDRIYSAQSPDPHQSMSLASIDSEGSWLSGRVGSRRTMSTMRDSIARANRREQPFSDSPANSTQEDLAVADDDYLSRFALDRNSGVSTTGRRSGEGRPSSDDGDEPMREENVKWGAVGARPQVVQFQHHDRDTMRSYEGLLNIDSGDEEDSEAPISPTSEDKVDLQRARSVNVGRGHGRNFSAGSAKLLDIHPRVSLDDKGHSQERRKSGPLIM